MWYILLLVGLAAAASDSYKDRRFQYIVSSQHLHLEKLERELHTLEEEFSKLSPDVDAHSVQQLKARITNLEGTGCPLHEAPCGGDVPQCISDLIFCDGHKDCKNGRDEDPEVCSLSVTHVGSSYTGLATWTACEEHEPHHAVITITASERKSFFPARVWLRATLSFETDEHAHTIRTIPLRGYYNFGRRAIVLGPQAGGGNHYGALCHFNLGDNDHADCKIVFAASRNICAHFNAARY